MEKLPRQKTRHKGPVRTANISPNISRRYSFHIFRKCTPFLVSQFNFFQGIKSIRSIRLKYSLVLVTGMMGGAGGRSICRRSPRTLDDSSFPFFSSVVNSLSFTTSSSSFKVVSDIYKIMPILNFSQ